jgi:sulfate adenylyltransferase small subunit/sulfate ABC transporter ATP-binding protein
VSIEIRSVTKIFNGFRALTDVDLTVKSGELMALLGPSGSGKTTLLRIVAGLEVPDWGSILLNGEDATSRSVRERNVGFVFQHYDLFRHMNVFDNVAFGLTVRPRRLRPSKGEIRQRVGMLLRLIQLEQLAYRFPAQLSGGQRQRVALARALAVEPQVLLLDEPFGALDARVRQELRKWLRRLHDEIHLTSVFVTHDQEEALEVADRIVIMNQGRIEQIGTPEEVWDRPANPFIFHFLGNVNLFHARANGRPAGAAGTAVDPPVKGMEENNAPVAYVRPYDIEINRARRYDDDIEVSVGRINAAGSVVRLELKRSDTCELVEAELSRDRYRELDPAAGETVFIRPRNIRVFPEVPPPAVATDGEDAIEMLEHEAIRIIREAVAEAERPVMLYSIGKDSSVMLHLALKAFYPMRLPFPLLHVDTTWKFREMIAFRDALASRLGLELITYTNEDGLKQGVDPFTYGSRIYTEIMKTDALRQALNLYSFDMIFGGARREEEKSRAKERVYSFRDERHRWDPRGQRPEVWSIPNLMKNRGESFRVFPLSNWTELDIWRYIAREKIPVVPLYFAAVRPVVERDGQLIMVDDERMHLDRGERPGMKMVRFRTLGCYPLTAAVESSALTVEDVVRELESTRHSERAGRLIDFDQAGSMEKKKQEGYF